MSALGPPVTIVAVDDSHRGAALLRRFFDEAYVEQFPDPNERESLPQMRRYLRLKAQGWYGSNNYHVLVALQGEAVIGGAVFDYLALPNAGVVEFLFVLPCSRGSGLGRRLLDAGTARLAADARTQGKRLKALVAEMNDPFRHPDGTDNMNPFARALTWDRWGFYKLLCPYTQPALSARQVPVDYLCLIIRPMRASASTTVSAAWLLELVAQYMRWAMRIADPLANREYLALQAYLGRRARVALQPLAASIGQDRQRPFDVHELGSTPREIEAAVRLARREIPQPGRVASAQQFHDALGAGPCYHLWRISEPKRRAMSGMASFFSLAGCGFGGYVVLAGRLRGRGLLAPVLARMEAQMMADGVRTPGWFIECGADSAGAFVKRGFGEVPLEYRPPAVGATAARARDKPERLHLLYKPFGGVYPPVVLKVAFIGDCLRQILAGVYGLRAPGRSPCYALAQATLLSDAEGRVHLSQPRP